MTAPQGPQGKKVPMPKFQKKQTAPKRKARAPPRKQAGVIQTKTKQAKKNGGRISNYKIAASDAPSRVEKCELIRSYTYRAPSNVITVSPPGISDMGVPDISNEEFGGQTLFLFLPQYAQSQLMVIHTPGWTVPMQDFSIATSSADNLARLSTTPQMSTFNNTSQHARCMVINGSLVVQTEFGLCNGIMRWKRYTLRDSHRTPSELLDELKAGVQGVFRKTLSGSDTIVMHAGVQNRNHLSQYTETLSNHWGYHPNEDSDVADKGLSPLSGWIFAVTNVSATSFMPAPTIHLGIQVRVQRELTLDNAYLTDTSPPIDPDKLSHFKRNEEPTCSFRGKMDDIRGAADAAASLGTAALTLLSLKKAVGGHRLPLAGG